MSRHALSHALGRRRALESWRAGATRVESLCDADFLLVTAAKFHGWEVGQPCPVCGDSGLRRVYWIYGDTLGHMSGTARTLEEIERIATLGHEFSVHTVEVCPRCEWNHLLYEEIVRAA